jgi:GNAT superfamily N-acetyltransferase
MEAFLMIIRKITAFERDGVKEFYFALSAEDRRKRFCGTLSDAAISMYVDSLDFARHTILGAFSPHAELIGLAELAPGTTESELAFAVRPDMRCRRIGTRLMERILLHARMSGIGKVFVMFLSENTPMRNLAKRAAMQVTADDSEASASRELPAPTAEELSYWFMKESVAHSEYFSVLGIERWRALVSQSQSTAHQPEILCTLSRTSQVIT